MAQSTRPLTYLIAALGGEGGGFPSGQCFAVEQRLPRGIARVTDCVDRDGRMRLLCGPAKPVEEFDRHRDGAGGQERKRSAHVPVTLAQ